MWMGNIRPGRISAGREATVRCLTNGEPLPQVAKLPFLINDGKWHHLCITWTTRDGIWEAFQDGVTRGSGENLAPYHPIKPEGVLVLGQEQVSAHSQISCPNGIKCGCEGEGVSDVTECKMYRRVCTSK